MSAPDAYAGLRPWDATRRGNRVEEEAFRGVGSNGGGQRPPINTSIAGLLAGLPKSGNVGQSADRKLWLLLLEEVFS
jgi:hypothetical protein